MKGPTVSLRSLGQPLARGCGALLFVAVFAAVEVGATATAATDRQRWPTLAAAGGSGPRQLARRSRKSKVVKSTPAVAVEPVKVRSLETPKATLQVGKSKGAAVFLVAPGKPLELGFSGPGQLTLHLHQLVPVKQKKAVEVSVELSIDGKKVKPQQLPGVALKRAKLTGGPAGVVAKPKRWSDTVAAGVHTVTVAVPEGTLAVAVLIELKPSGAKSLAPVVVEPLAKSPDLMAAALELLDDDEPSIAAAPPPPPAPPPTAPPPVEVVAATPTTPPPKEESVAERLQRRISSGEVRDGLVDTYEPVQVADQETGERLDFFRVAPERTFSFMVAGPGVVTVRLHRLIDPAQTAVETKPSFAVAILENDVLLQRLTANTELSTNKRLVAPLTGDLRLAEAKEYQLKVGPKKSTLALLIAEAPEGMVIRYDFAAEEQSLAAMALDLGDDDEDLLGVSASVMPTVVMEIDLSKKIVTTVEVREDFFAFLVQAGVHLPHTGGQPGVAAALELDVMLPVWGRRLGLGVRGALQQHQLSLRLADPDGAAVSARTSALTVPVLGELVLRLPFGSPASAELAVVVQGGAGVAYLRASRRALGATASAAELALAVHGGGALELKLGPGWLALAGDYLWGPPVNLGAALDNYSVQGASAALRYRLGF